MCSFLWETPSLVCGFRVLGLQQIWAPGQPGCHHLWPAAPSASVPHPGSPCPSAAASVTASGPGETKTHSQNKCFKQKSTTITQRLKNQAASLLPQFQLFMKNITAAVYVSKKYTGKKKGHIIWHFKRLSILWIQYVGFNLRVCSLTWRADMLVACRACCKAWLKRSLLTGVPAGIGATLLEGSAYSEDTVTEKKQKMNPFLWKVQTNLMA